MQQICHPWWSSISAPTHQETETFLGHQLPLECSTGMIASLLRTWSMMKSSTISSQAPILVSPCRFAFVFQLLEYLADVSFIPVYNPAHAKTLVAAVNQYLSPSGTFLLMNFPERRRRGMDSFVQELKKHGSVSEVKYKLWESLQGLEKCSDIHLVIFKKYLLCLCN